MATLFFKGILCNLLVCLAVWLAYAGRSVTDKIVASDLAHLRLSWRPASSTASPTCISCRLLGLTVELGGLPDSFDASTITLAGSARNLVAVTLGNIVGGAGLVGFVYWVIYRKGLGSS